MSDQPTNIGRLNVARIRERLKELETTVTEFEALMLGHGFTFRLRRYEGDKAKEPKLSAVSMAAWLLGLPIDHIWVMALPKPERI